MKKVSALLTITAKLKPILIKILPYDLLSKMKRKYLNRDIKHLSKYKKKECDFQKFPEGVNLIANIKADTGLGESSRIVASDLQNANIPFTIYDVSLPGQGGRTNEQFTNKITNTLPYSINIIHINPHEMATALKTVGYDILDYHYNIGFWSWELEDFPMEWKGCIDVLDEIWTPSEFTSNSIRKITDKPIRTLPHCVMPIVDKKCDRNYFGLPEDLFLFLIVYNSGSVAERKNPYAAIEAYKKAFGNLDEKVGLVVKTSSASEEEIDKLKQSLQGVKNVYYIVDNLKKEEMNSLINDIDVYVSLHRAEGFGLVLAEAMYLGKAVIATGWSANMEFMNENIACIIDYKLVPVETERGGFSKESLWADASIKTTVKYMKKLCKDKEFYNGLCIRAQKYIKEELSIHKTSDLLKNYYEEIIRKEL